MNKKVIGWVVVAVVAVAALLAGLYLRGKQSQGGNGGGIAVGAIIPLTGAAAVFGEYNQQSTRVIVNSFSGETGVPVLLHIEDSKSTSKDGTAAWQRLTSLAGDVKIVSTELSSVSMALAPLAAQEDRLLLAIAATPALAGNPNVIRIYPTASAVAEKFTSHIMTIPATNRRTVALLYLDDEYGKSVAKDLRERLNTAGIADVREETFGSANDTKSSVSKLTPCDIFVVVGFGQRMGLSIRDVRSANPDAVILCSIEFAFSDVLASVDVHDDKLMYLSFDKMPDELVRFLSQKLGRKPNPVDILVFDGLGLALNAANGLLADSKTVGGHALAQALRGRTFAFHGRQLTVDEEGNVSYTLRVLPANTLSE